MRNAFVNCATQLTKDVAAALGTPIVCEKGCHWCCRQWTDATEDEAGAIAGWIAEERRDGNAVAHDIVGRLRDYLHQLSTRRRDAQWESIEDEDEKRDLHWDLGLYCPFLSKQRECDVLELCPFVCRTYLVAGSADACMTGGRTRTVGTNFDAVFEDLMSSGADAATKQAMQEGYRYQYHAFRQPTDLLPVLVARELEAMTGETFPQPV